jgi:transcription elongation factor Elf1
MIAINCSQCGAETKLSLLNSNYKGTFRCWKCRRLFDIEIVNDELELYQPLSEEEFQRRQEVEALKAKFKRPRKI